MKLDKILFKNNLIRTRTGNLFYTFNPHSQKPLTGGVPHSDGSEVGFPFHITLEYKIFVWPPWHPPEVIKLLQLGPVV